MGYWYEIYSQLSFISKQGAPLLETPTEKSFTLNLIFCLNIENITD